MPIGRYVVNIQKNSFITCPAPGGENSKLRIQHSFFRSIVSNLIVFSMEKNREE
jgi:hypothetical protein